MLYGSLILNTLPPPPHPSQQNSSGVALPPACLPVHCCAIFTIVIPASHAEVSGSEQSSPIIFPARGGRGGGRREEGGREEGGGRREEGGGGKADCISDNGFFQHI